MSFVPVWLKVDGKLRWFTVSSSLFNYLTVKFVEIKTKDQVILHHALQNVRKSTEPKRRGR